ncbi:MAG: S41 family peptidase [Solirubrobacteraceae bacterium]
MFARSAKSVASVFGALLILLLGIIWGGHPDALPGFARDALVSGQENRVLDDAVSEVLHDYYRPLKRSELIDTSVAALVASLHDRFSTYFTAQQYREFNSAEQFSGVGMNVRGDRRGLRVVQVFDGSPAARAQIRPGDVIDSAGGVTLAGRSDTAATALIKGRPGTDVVLGVLRAGAPHRTVRVTRAEVSVPVVSSRMESYAGKKIAYVALATFSSGAHGEVRQALDRLRAQGARAVVLDLRHNGGGLVDEPRLVASAFIADGPIVTTRGRTQPTTTITAAGDAIPAGIPVAVLVDNGTASASEIVAGALQDRRRATIVGTHTFGKGVFQEVRPLSNGGALDITVGEYFLPGGRNLGGGGIKQGGGITPDVTVAATGRAPLQRALGLLAAKLP